MNRTVEVDFPPKRIISLVPSQTELLYDLGLRDEVVGQTLFCVHPAEMHRQKPRIGGTKKLDIEKIAALQPGLVIGNKEENDQSQIEALMKLYPVWMSDIRSLDDALLMIKSVGEIVGRKTQAVHLVKSITLEFEKLAGGSPAIGVYPPASNVRALTSAYLIWKGPWMAAGPGTFINDMLQKCGLQNAFQHHETRYPELTAEALLEAHPQVILLSSEPFPFKQQDVHELQQLFPHACIRLVDGELFSWYGSRLLKSVAYFTRLLAEIHAAIGEKYA